MPNQPSKFRIKNWVEINDDSGGTNNTNIQTDFKTMVLKLSLLDYSETITVPDTSTAADLANNRKKKVIFKNCATFTDSIGAINITQVDNAKNINVMMLM